MALPFTDRPSAFVGPSSTATDRPHLVLIQGGLDRPRPSLAVYRRRRIVAFALAVAIVVVAIAGARAVLRPFVPEASSAPPARTDAVPTYVVQPGDTLWSIAGDLTSGDVRATVDRLVAANGASALAPGDELVLPAG